MKFSDEAGNVVIESVLGILIFAGVIFPATSMLSQLATRQVQVSQAVIAIGRSWSAVDDSSAVTNLNSVVKWLSSSQNLKVDLDCAGPCNDEARNLQVRVTAETGFPLVPTISETYEFTRDVYAD